MPMTLELRFGHRDAHSDSIQCPRHASLDWLRLSRLRQVDERSTRTKVVRQSRAPDKPPTMSDIRRDIPTMPDKRPIIRQSGPTLRLRQVRQTGLWYIVAASVPGGGACTALT
eukprot:7155635-Prymnesium_polylepis.1